MLTNKIRVLLVEDEEISRLGLAMLLQAQATIELVAAVADFEEAVSIAHYKQPDVVLLDLYLQDGALVERIPRLKYSDNAPKIIIITSATHISAPHIGAFQNGIHGLVMKNQEFNDLLMAIETVYHGQMWIDKKFTAALFGHLQNPRETNVDKNYPAHQSGREALVSNNIAAEARLASFSKREYAIAYYACQGVSAKNIAARLSISEKTVRNRLTAIYSKMSVSGQVQLCLKLKPEDFQHKAWLKKSSE